MGPRGKILVVEDDDSVSELLELTLSDVGYEVARASNGKEALRAVFAEPPDLIILDIMMAGLDGWEVCRRVREMSDIPIIMVTALVDQLDRIKGLELGADDYVTKPFDIHELILRVEAVLRRVSRGVAGTAELRYYHRYDDGHLFIDLNEHIVQYDGRPIKLTPNEFDLLACFVRQPGKTLSQDYLLRQVWGLSAFGRSEEYVKTYIRHLRKKIEPDPQHPRYILTERGFGYRLVRPTKK